MYYITCPLNMLRRVLVRDGLEDSKAKSLRRQGHIFCPYSRLEVEDSRRSPDLWFSFRKLCGTSLRGLEFSFPAFWPTFSNPFQCRQRDMSLYVVAVEVVRRGAAALLTTGHLSGPGRAVGRVCVCWALIRLTVAVFFTHVTRFRLDGIFHSTQ